MSLTILPMGVKNIAESKVGMERATRFLLMEEREPFEQEPEDPELALLVRDATFCWEAPDPAKGEAKDSKQAGRQGSLARLRRRTTARILKMTNPSALVNDDDAADGAAPRSSSIPAATATSTDAPGAAGKGGPTAIDVEDEAIIVPMGGDGLVPTLHNINVSLGRRELVGVCGAVGAGKTSLLSAVLGLMRMRPGGDVRIRGSFAYVAQQAWIFNASLRENVLLGAPFEQARYDQAIRVCCLADDIAILPNGDATEIGERGINLSGGQKQRVYAP